ncbi:unnamed protein product [Prunus armeniaca]
MLTCVEDVNPLLCGLVGAVGAVSSTFAATVARAVHVEVLDVINAIKLAWLHAWHKVDWQNCLHRLHRMLFKISQLFREGNHGVDALANHSIQGFGFTWWDTAPSFILSSSSRLAGHA